MWLKTAIVALCACTALADDTADRESWPLIFAAGEGDADEVTRLLVSGVDVHTRSKDGETALHVAAIRGDLPTVRALMSAGAEVDARTPPGQTLYMTPAMWALYHGHTELVSMLLQAGADPHAADENGKTLLSMSQEARQPAIEAMVRTRLVPNATLADGHIPAVGLGLYYTPPGTETYDIVRTALRAGYRHLDTAGFYGNEADVGRAVRDSGIPRAKIHITSKVWPEESDEQWVARPYDMALAAVQESVHLLGTHADLYLLHAPFNGPAARLQYWLALEHAQASGLVKQIGVSNFGVAHIKELLDSPQTRLRPAANEVELHPFLRKPAIEAFCADHGITVIAYSPLARAQRLEHPTLAAVAKSQKVSAAQVMVRWAVQKGFVPLPKSVREERVLQNIDVFTFTLSDSEMHTLDQLDEQLFTEWEEWGSRDPTMLP